MEPLEKPKLTVFYEKNPMYRTVYADGLIGGFTSANAVSLSFYATRNSIPKSVTYEIEPNNTLNPVGAVSQDSKVGVIREIEVGVYMNRDTAREIYEFFKKMFEENVR
ncbi:MAG: hypothetical protein JST42_00740 [Bacteroidetes bacterium]|nr:hypothetical protein [Bacteroidota bacterium]